MTPRRMLVIAVAAVASVVGLVLVSVIPASAQTTGWVRGTNADCASPVPLAEDAVVTVSEARFLCLQDPLAAGGRIDFEIDGSPAATERVAPYSLNAQAGWAPAVGAYALRGRVTDRAGSTHSKYLTIHVVADGQQDTPQPAPGPVPPPTTSPAAPAPAPAPAPPTPAPAPGQPAPAPGPAPNTGSWPGPDNTGVPAGTVLQPYTGPCEIHDDNVVIDSKQINCNGMLIYGAGTVIKKSNVVGEVRTNSPRATLRIEDSDINAGSDHSEAVGLNHVVVLRSDIRGDQHSVHCSLDCVVQDSWLHDQFDGRAMGWHQNGFLTNGGSDFTLQHNTISCTGRCTADIGLIPDDDISNVTITNNLLVASPDAGFCLYGGSSSGNKPGVASNVVIRDNVLQRGDNDKCGFYGAVVYFQPGNGNVWTNNTWDDGTQIPAG